MSDEVKNEIREKIKSYWERNNKPYLISLLGSEFNIKLKEFIGNKKIKEWVDENLEELDAEFYQSPEKKEYVGLIPKGESFEKKFSIIGDVKKITQSDQRKITIDFLTMLNKLDESDKKRISIPTDLIIKLMGK